MDIGIPQISSLDYKIDIWNEYRFFFFKIEELDLISATICRPLRAEVDIYWALLNADLVFEGWYTVHAH